MLPLGDILLVWWSSWIRDLLDSIAQCRALPEKKEKKKRVLPLSSAVVELIPFRPAARHLASAAEPLPTGGRVPSSVSQSRNLRRVVMEWKS